MTNEKGDWNDDDDAEDDDDGDGDYTCQQLWLHICDRGGAKYPGTWGLGCQSWTKVLSFDQSRNDVISILTSKIFAMEIDAVLPPGHQLKHESNYKMCS